MRTELSKVILAFGIVFVAIVMPLNAQGKHGEAEKVGQHRDMRRPCMMDSSLLTEEDIDRIMKRLRQVDPNEAAALEKLRVEEPNEFKEALRETMWARMQSGDGQQQCSKGEISGERLRERADEYIEWLKVNYPEEAARLSELKKVKPSLYNRKLMLGVRKYWRVVDASETNPELAQTLRDDLELKGKVFSILRQIKETTDEAERRELVSELEKTTSARFDVILKRKQMEYDMLREELERLQRHVEKSEMQLNKYKVNKAERVQERVKELLNQTEEFDWD